VAVLVQGAKAGGPVPAPIAAKIIEETLALDRGYDPGVQALAPAVGNFNFVESSISEPPLILPAAVACRDIDAFGQSAL
jgi:hypothetical protein